MFVSDLVANGQTQLKRLKQTNQEPTDSCPVNVLIALTAITAGLSDTLGNIGR